MFCFLSHPHFLSNTFLFLCVLSFYSGCFFPPCFSFFFLSHFFNHSLSSFPYPFSLSTSPLAFFYQVQTTFLPSCLFRKTIFSTDAKLLLNQSTCSKSILTTIYYVFFLPILHSFRSFLPINSLFTGFSDKENRFSSSRKIGARTWF